MFPPFDNTDIVLPRHIAGTTIPTPVRPSAIQGHRLRPLRSGLFQKLIAGAPPTDHSRYSNPEGNQEEERDEGFRRLSVALHKKPNPKQSGKPEYYPNEDSGQPLTKNITVSMGGKRVDKILLRQFVVNLHGRWPVSQGE